MRLLHVKHRVILQIKGGIPTLFMVMDYQAGGTLQDLIDINRDTMRECYIRQLFGQLMLGVSTSVASKFRSIAVNRF